MGRLVMPGEVGGTMGDTLVGDEVDRERVPIAFVTHPAPCYEEAQVGHVMAMVEEMWYWWHCPEKGDGMVMLRWKERALSPGKTAKVDHLVRWTEE